MARPRAEFVVTADDKTAATFQQVENRLRAVGRQLKPLAIGAAAAGAALAAATVRAVASADAIAKNARAAGLNAETYQELAFAASQAGVRQEQFDAAMVRFTKRLGLADQGLGAAKRAYEDFGISTRDANGALRSSDDVFREVTAKIAALDDATARTAATTQFFGDDAARLRLLLEQGNSGIDEMAATARDLGLVLSNDLLRGAEQASDQLDRMQRIAGVQATRALAELFPLVIGLGNAAVEVAPKIRQLFDIFDSGSELRLRNQLEGVRERMAELREEVAAGRVDRSGVFGGGFQLPGFQDREGRELTADEMEARLREYRDLEAVAEAIQARLSAATAAPRSDGEGLIPNAPGVGVIPGIGDPDKNVAAAQAMFDRLYEVRLAAEQRDVELEQVRRDRELEKLELQRQRLIDDGTITAELEAQFRQARENAIATSEARIVQIKQRSAQQQAQSEQRLQQQVSQYRTSAFQAGLGLLQAFAGQSKTAAVALLAIEKAKAIADILIRGQQAAWLAQATIPPPGGQVLAAKLIAGSRISAALVGAQGLAQSASMGGGGGGSFAGGGAAIAPVDRATRLPIAGEQVQERQTNAAATVVRLEFGGGDGLVRELMGAIRAEVSEGDAVLIDPDSRQAIEIRAG